MDIPFVPADFEPPTEFTSDSFHLEVLGPRHNDRDHAAWMSSIDHIRATPGFSEDEEPGWPTPMSLESNMDDLVRHQRDFEERKGFTYSILDGDEVFGCVYIYPHKGDHDAAVSCWVTATRSAMDEPVRDALWAWVRESWPFTNPHFAGVT